jgi:tetratricopeptide (TPR) repeat protein
MATRKKTTQPPTSGRAAAARRPQPPAPPKRQPSAAYLEAVRTFSEGLELFHRAAYGEALEKFRSLDGMAGEEPALVGRARIYRSVCERKLREERFEPKTAEERSYLAVVRANEGRLEEALALLDQAIEERPRHAGYFYARASVHALRGDAGAAASDLRKAIELEPNLRFPALNDPDFQAVRDDPRIVDLVEPTATEV